MVILPHCDATMGRAQTGSYFSRYPEASRYRARTQQPRIGPKNDQGHHDLGNP
jgi:hypothetical protein